jgi:hypothetical protein
LRQVRRRSGSAKRSREQDCQNAPHHMPPMVDHNLRLIYSKSSKID